MIKTGAPQGSVLGPLFLIYLNDISNASELFNFISYADDSTLSGSLSLIDTQQTDNINSHLDKISEWLKVNKLTLNEQKTKFMIFYQKNKVIHIPIIRINNTEIECVNSFNLLGIELTKDLSWKNDIDKISYKILRSVGILGRLKYILPQYIKIMIYNSLILSHLNYGILAWGYDQRRLFTLQKQSIRHITCAKYNSHTEPLFKYLKLLKLSEIFSIAQLKFYFRYKNYTLPEYFRRFPYYANMNIHSHRTRNRTELRIPRVKHAFANKCIRNSFPNLINNLEPTIKEKIDTHSLSGFTRYVKTSLLDKYSISCQIVNCFVCQNI